MDERPRLQPARAVSALLFIYAAISCGLILAFNPPGWRACQAPFSGGWAACDQNWHLILINYLIQNPTAVLHYPDRELVANFPGFHLLIAWTAKLLSLGQLGPETWLRVIPFALGAGTLAILWSVFRDLANAPWYAVVLALPIMGSNYFYLSSLFLVTENAAYLGYAFLLMAYLRFPHRGAAVGLAGAGMVFARQSFLPVIATHIFAFPWASPARGLDRGRIRALCLGILPPIALAAVYVGAWHGLVPPELAAAYATGSLVESGPLTQAVALLGVLAIPYGFLARPALRALGTRRLFAIALIASAAALVLWIAVPTTRDLDAGRAGSFFWLIARASPAIGDRALLALPLLALGLAALGLMIELARFRRYTPIELIMLGFYVAGLAIQPLSYQRYSEVVTLIALSTTAARLGAPSRWGLLSFASAYAGKFVVTLLLANPG